MFTRDFLVALSNWQNGWSENQERRRIIADELVNQCMNLPEEYKIVDVPCYRKRFILEGEILPILVDDDFFEGIASWTTEKGYAKEFKGIVKPNTKFVMLFKHQPLASEVIININLLWQDPIFQKEADKFKEADPEMSKPLFNFKNYQSEIILRSTLKGSEIEDIVGISSSFETLCDMANIPEEKRRELSIKYARDPNGIPIEIPAFVGARPSKEAISNTLVKFKDLLEDASNNNIFVDWSRAVTPHNDDLKHKL